MQSQTAKNNKKTGRNLALDLSMTQSMEPSARMIGVVSPTDAAGNRDSLQQLMNERDDRTNLID